MQVRPPFRVAFRVPCHERLSPLARTARRMDYSRRIRTHAEPHGMTTLEPMRFGTVTGETYGGPW